MLSYSQPHRSILLENQDVVTIPCISSYDLSVESESFSNSRIAFNRSFAPEELIGREVYIEYQIQVSFQAHVNAAGDTMPLALPYSEYTLAANPLHRCCKSAKVTLNGGLVSEIDPSLIRNPLGWFESPEYLLQVPDVCNNLGAQSRCEIIQILPDPGTAATIPTLADWTSNHMMAESHFRNNVVSNPTSASRGSYKPISVTFSESVATEGYDTVTLVYHIQEKLWHPIFYDAPYSTLGNVSSLDVSLDLQSLLPMFQVGIILGYNNVSGVRSYGNQVATVVFDPAYVPKMLLRCYTPALAPPRELKVPYVKFETLTFPAAGPVAVGASSSITAKSISLSCIPNQMFVFLRPSAGNWTTHDADSYCPITRISINTPGQQRILSDCDQFQLFQLSKLNGLRQTFEQFSNMCGSVMCLDLSKSDVAGYIPGEMRKFDFDLTCEFTNTSYLGWDIGATAEIGSGRRTGVTNADLNWTLCIVCTYEAHINLDSGGKSSIDYGLSRSRIAKIIRHCRGN